MDVPLFGAGDVSLAEVVSFQLVELLGAAGAGLWPCDDVVSDGERTVIIESKGVLSVLRWLLRWSGRR